MPSWREADRERAYTALCEAVTAAGPEGESLYLARLVLLLGERLADADALEACIRAAAVRNPVREDPAPSDGSEE
jgi:hypothetical protein